MPVRRMFIVAGPPGGGKSSVFSLLDLAKNVFNADDRAAQLNAGSYEKIPLSVRALVNREYEEFVRANIRSGCSFAVETTLRTTITFEQAKLAKDNGFRVSMLYVALDTVERHIERVKRRAAHGGHSASEATLRRIHASSLSNLALAVNAQKDLLYFLQTVFVVGIFGLRKIIAALPVRRGAKHPNASVQKSRFCAIPTTSG
jgi:predicted ABC-type ATPase